MSDQITIAVIDDHPIFRTGLIRVLNDEPGFLVVGEGNSADDAVRIALGYAPDVILLDLNMPGGGLVAARQIVHKAPHVKVVMLTMVDDDNIMLEALGIGAKGYILKGVGAVELIQTIRTLSDGESYIPPGLAARIMDAQTSSGQAPALSPSTSRLSDLECQILNLVIDGKSNKAIAESLAVDVNQVRAAIESLLLQFHRRLQELSSMPPGDNPRKLH